MSIAGQGAEQCLQWNSAEVVVSSSTDSQEKELLSVSFTREFSEGVGEVRGRMEALFPGLWIRIDSFQKFSSVRIRVRIQKLAQSGSGYGSGSTISWNPDPIRIRIRIRIHNSTLEDKFFQRLKSRQKSQRC
jgi:hypothetical protein